MYYVEPINSDSIELQNALTEHEVIEKQEIIVMTWLPIWYRRFKP